MAVLRVLAERLGSDVDRSGQRTSADKTTVRGVRRPVIANRRQGTRHTLQSIERVIQESYGRVRIGGNDGNSLWTECTACA